MGSEIDALNRELLFVTRETAWWTQVYAWAAIAQAIAVVGSVAIILLQLRALRQSLTLSIYGSAYKSLAEVTDIALVNEKIAAAMNWGTAVNVFVWRLISHCELVYNLWKAGHISEADWEAEYDFIRDCCKQPDFQNTWGDGSTQFTRSFRQFLTEEILKARQSA